MKRDVPFYKQSWDPEKWRELGFASAEDLRYWKVSSCGVLCLKMAIDSFLLAAGKELSSDIPEYAKRGVSAGAYAHDVGWSHEGLAHLARLFGFYAYARERVPARDVMRMLDNGYLSIVSIQVDFRDTRTLKERFFFWKKRGGHLALVVGYEKEKDSTRICGFYVHHTSIRPEWDGAYIFVPVKQFRKGFTGRCVFLRGR